jgi:hypothetical protein
MNIRRRLDSLEKRLISEPIILKMRDGRTERLRGRGDYVLDLVLRAWRGERTPVIELIGQSLSSTELGGGHMLDLVRADLNGPAEEAR